MYTTQVGYHTIAYADSLIPYPNGQFLAEHIPGAQLATFPGVGHLLMIEAPEGFNREVMEFLG